MSPKKDVSQERKQQIMEAAQNVFSRAGFHKARMSDIAEQSGLSKGTLYWYFDSKEDIILNLLDRLFETELQTLEKLIGDQRSSEERLRVYADHVIKDMLQMMKWIPIAYEFITLAFRKKIIQKALHKYYQKHMDILTPILQQGMDRGELTAESAQDAAVAVGAILEGTLMLWVYDPEGIEIDRHIRSSLDLLIRGLRTEG